MEWEAETAVDRSVDGEYTIKIWKHYTFCVEYPQSPVWNSLIRHAKENYILFPDWSSIVKQYSLFAEFYRVIRGSMCIQ